jgi:tRNA dimethylallyltransferase
MVPGRGIDVLPALVGPTASGKTEASLSLAEALGAEIVCADSMLVYRGMDVGTAKPSAAERVRVPHHLIDLVDPAEPFSVAAFQKAARRALEDLAERKRPALLVGGSGLYVRAVVDELDFPGTLPGTRRLLEAEELGVGAEGLHRRLASFDPAAAARIEPGNVRRTVRALEVAAITGRPFSTFAASWKAYPRGRVRAAGIDLPRDVLHHRIENRVQMMMPRLLDEVGVLLEKGFGGFLTSSQAIGYAEAVACLEGQVSQAEAAAATIRRTKALARRQLAWFRRDPRVTWFRSGNEGAAGVVDELLEYLVAGGG